MTFSAPALLTGSRVRLEPLSYEHEKDLCAAVLPGKLWETWYTAVPSPETMHDEIDRRLALQAAGNMLPWAIIDAHTNHAVGMTTFMNIDAAHRRVEIGSTWIGKESQRSHINTETKLLTLTHAFETLEAIAVEFRTHWHNQQSRAAIARLGAKQDGVLRSHQVSPDGMLRDTVVFSIIACEWPTVRQSLRYRLNASQLQRSEEHLPKSEKM